MTKKRAQMTQGGGIDWNMTELLAIGSFTGTGIDVRFVGEDICRGAFTPHHAVLVSAEDGSEYNLIDAYRKSKDGEHFMIYNSALTEYVGMGFEYGYALGNPDAAVFWEAQFGDFANGAQTTVDQYASSDEAKWGQTSKLVLPLPHGYEGVGSDHSSTHTECFLQLAAGGSCTAARPSGPANYLRLLRRHILSDPYRPLVVLSPKSMLRNELAVFDIEDFTGDVKFHAVIDDPHFTSKDKSGVKTLPPCPGEVYWDLGKKCKKDKRDDVAIACLEVLYPLPHNRPRGLFKSHPDPQEVRWAQGEPANQDSWPFLALNLPEVLPDIPKLTRISRRAQSSTTTGVAKVHQIEEKALLEETLRQVSLAGLTS